MTTNCPGDTDKLENLAPVSHYHQAEERTPRSLKPDNSLRSQCVRKIHRFLILSLLIDSISYWANLKMKLNHICVTSSKLFTLCVPLFRLSNEEYNGIFLIRLLNTENSFMHMLNTTDMWVRITNVIIVITGSDDYCQTFKGTLNRSSLTNA